MLFKKSKQVSLEKVIRTIDDYREAQNQLAHLKHEAKVVVTYMRQPKTNPLNDKIVMMTDDKMINSGYMLDLAKQVEVLADKCWAYEQDHTVVGPKRLIVSELDSADTLCVNLRMYGKYLKDRKNPQVLNKDELRLIKYDDYNGNYSFEISGEKYDRINQAVDRVEDGMFHALMLGLRGFGNFIRTLSKYLAD